MTHAKQYTITKACIYCGKPVNYTKSGWLVKYPTCDEPECQAANKAASLERGRLSTRAVYDRHGGPGNYKKIKQQEQDALDGITPIEPPPPAKCATPGCRNTAHKAYDGLVQYTRCKQCLKKLNTRARVVEASLFSEAQLYF